MLLHIDSQSCAFKLKAGSSLLCLTSQISGLQLSIDLILLSLALDISLLDLKFHLLHLEERILLLLSSLCCLGFSHVLLQKFRCSLSRQLRNLNLKFRRDLSAFLIIHIIWRRT